MALFDIWRNLCLRLHEICAIRRFVRRYELQRGSPAIAISIGGRPECAEVSPVQGRTFSIGVGFGKGCRASMAYGDSLADGCTHRRVVGELAMRATDGQAGRDRAHRHTRTDVFHRPRWSGPNGRFPLNRVLRSERQFATRTSDAPVSRWCGPGRPARADWQGCSVQAGARWPQCYLGKCPTTVRMWTGLTSARSGRPPGGTDAEIGNFGRGVYRMRRLPLFFERLAVRGRPDPVRGSLTRGAGVARRRPATLTSSSRPGHRIPSPSPRSSHFWR